MPILLLVPYLRLKLINLHLLLLRLAIERRIFLIKVFLPHLLALIRVLVLLGAPPPQQENILLGLEQGRRVLVQIPVGVLRMESGAGLVHFLLLWERTDNLLLYSV